MFDVGRSSLNFVSRTQGTGDSIKTAYFMIADKPHTMLNVDEPLNDELDKYWFNQNTHTYDESGQHNGDSIIKIFLPNYRAFPKNPVNDEVILTFDDVVISKEAHLYLCVYDLDDKAEEMKEKVRVLINGQNPDDEGEKLLISTIEYPDNKWHKR